MDNQSVAMVCGGCSLWHLRFPAGICGGAVCGGGSERTHIGVNIYIHMPIYNIIIDIMYICCIIIYYIYVYIHSFIHVQCT